MESERIVERSAKYIRVGDVIIRKGVDKVVRSVAPYKTRFGNRYDIWYEDGTIDNLYASSTVKSKTPRR